MECICKLWFHRTPIHSCSCSSKEQNVWKRVKLNVQFFMLNRFLLFFWVRNSSFFAFECSYFIMLWRNFACLCRFLANLFSTSLLFLRNLLYPPFQVRNVYQISSQINANCFHYIALLSHGITWTRFTNRNNLC